MFTRVDHLVIAVPDVALAIERYETLGFHVFDAGRSPEGHTRTAVGWYGDQSLELTAPEDGADPALRAHVAAGGGIFRIAIASDDLDGDVGAMRARGVDLGAIDAIHRRLLAARDAGLAVLLVSSELSEILALSDRIVVMTGGRLVHETTPATTDERTLGLHMTGRATLIDTPFDTTPEARA